MVHAKRPWLTVEELVAAIGRQREPYPNSGFHQTASIEIGFGDFPEPEYVDC
jgi:hypothetical protein